MSEKKYRFLKHTADAKFQAFGKTLEEAFGNAALATASLMWEWETVDHKVKYTVDVEGKDLKQLLVVFLEEILFLWEVQDFLLGKVEDLVIHKEEEAYTLHAVFRGDINKGIHETFGDVKAITYNEMEILEKNGFRVQVVVDI
ncbi:MAG: archease [Candidatus Aminicenantes bacterium]|nr:archease [Candidatus Aminicenantes bacterium]